MIDSKAKWHQGVASLVTYLRHHNHTVDLLEINKYDLDYIGKFVNAYSPDMVAATANSHQYAYIKPILTHIKKTNPDIYTVIGGVHTTIVPETAEELKNVDAVCRGEGEEPLLKIADMLQDGKEPHDIENIIFPPKTGTTPAPCTYFVKDLNTLPIADRTILKRYREADRSELLPFTVRFLFCRGCPFNCSYCCNKALKEVFPNPKSYVRRVTVDRAIEEIKTVSEMFKFRHFAVDDDIFTLDKKWTMEFCNKYPNEFKSTKTFDCNVRIGTIDEDLMRALKDIGCKHIEVGIESGDPEIRQQVLHRKMTDEMILHTANMAKKAGIGLMTFNMVGIPGESRTSIFKTIRINQIIRPDTLQVTVFYPYSYTPLGEYAKEKGMIKDTVDNYTRKTVLKHDKLTKIEIEIYALLLKILIYSSYSLKKAFDEIIFLSYKFPPTRFIHKVIKVANKYINKYILLKFRPPKLIECELSEPINEADYQRYKRLGLKPVKITQIDINDLQCAVTYDFEDVLEPFFKTSNGQIDRSIMNTPLYKLLKYYQKHGYKILKRSYKNLDYYKYFLSFNKIGHKTNFYSPSIKEPVHYTDNSIWKKIEGFLNIYKSISKNGYLGGKYKGSYISVLKKPFVVTRMGVDDKYKPHEVFLGHHRASCLAALGHKEVKVILLEDTRLKKNPTRLQA